MNFLKKLFSNFNRKAEPPFNANELTEEEKQYCKEADLSEADGLFLKKISQNPIDPLEFNNEYSDAEKPTGICSSILADNTRELIAANRERFSAQGKCIFIFDYSGHDYIVAIVAEPDPYKVMEYAETNGINFDIEPKDVIAKWKEWDERFGIIPLGIGFDFCECEIVNRNMDYMQLAKEVYEFCPDVVDQGTETVETFAEEMKQNGTIYLWWD